MNGDQELDEMITAVRRIGTLAEDTAKRAVPLVDAAVKQTAADGVAPDGKPWPPTKSGGRALANAAAHITTKAYGTVVRVVLSGVEVFHNFGSKRLPKRQVIWDGGSTPPENIAAAIKKAASDAFSAATGAR